ncbi:GspE/PulE family protein [Planctomyces sp. SH-PL14]|uniref:GspE/PulE family protein n=1 Tax=Planctomyces sp. SH-PL14 TaxID=1632864 RepID=UPI00078B17F5|nr:GspE/PulE family protein [Planctomyces sp. SH-PL14]AMV18373.1 Putative type II secretion system protein E [Planctomyces sp. SH-PL14]
MDIGALLLQRGLIQSHQLAGIRGNGRRVDQILVEQGVITEEAALKALADELGMRFVSLKNFEVDRNLLMQFPATAIFRHSVLPLERTGEWVTMATSDPFDLEALDELSSLGNCRIQPVMACRDEIVELIKQNLGVGGDTINQLVAQRAEEGVELLDALPEGEVDEAALAPSVIRLVNELLMEALEQRSSDVHLEPQEKGFVIRFRVDGLLRVQPVPPEINHFASAIVTRLKIMARLNIAEKRLPQDGRINLRVRGREIDVRMSIIPMLHGEGVVLRLLDKSRMVFDLKRVGMPPELDAKFKDIISLPHGIVLVTGPTGSGKTSTLYSALGTIKSPETKIITVEDPVEYHMDGISQIQVHAKIGLTFAAGLRSILRHDPDVVLIGEIRDGETATSAIQASLTGHLVFSTLHTNDAPSSFTRLVDMGVEPYLVASTVEGILAQRLVRVLCSHCKEEFTPDEESLPDDLPRPVKTLWRPKGCRNCRESGFAGRTGIFELLINDPVIRNLCVERASAATIRDHCLKHGMTTLRQSGYQKVLLGQTAIDEVVRTTRGDIG